jgi:sarcosine oxidase subunit beta
VKKLKTQVAIVGGGIIGASAALFMRRRGLLVVLLERDACGSRSSGINYGGVRRQGRTMAQLPLAGRAHEIWGELQNTIGIDGEYVRSGHLKLARTAKDMASLEAYRDRTRGFGMHLELLSAADIRRRYPWLGDAVVGGSLCPEDGHANPRLVSPAFARAAECAGARVIEGCKVERVERHGADFEVVCADGLTVAAETVVNCAGAWAGAFAKDFGEPVPMVQGHPLMAVTEPLPLFMSLSLGMEGGGIYGRQVSRGNCVIGGTRGYAIDENAARPSNDGLMAVMRDALALLPDLAHASIIRTWTGSEGYLPDRQPVVGASATTPGLFHAFGFAGAGFQIGPAVGEAIAELVHTGVSSQPLEAFDIRRFAPRAQLGTG